MKNGNKIEKEKQKYKKNKKSKYTLNQMQKKKCYCKYDRENKKGKIKKKHPDNLAYLSPMTIMCHVVDCKTNKI